jgi:sugar phosphate permease
MLVWLSALPWNKFQKLAGKLHPSPSNLAVGADNDQIMFLVFGLITILTGILVILFLPDNPMTSRLSDREKMIAVSRLRVDTTGVENKLFKPAQFHETLRDRHVWLICIITTAINIPNAAVSTFQASIIKG